MPDYKSTSEEGKEPASELIETEEAKEYPEYSEDEKKYIGGIVVRLRDAKMNRDQKHPEFNNKNYIEQYNENERIANTYLPGKKFDGDIDIASGTVEQKLFAVLSEMNRLSLEPQVIAYDQNNNELVMLGRAMSDVINDTSERDLDKELRLARQIELMKQGTVYVQETWSKEYKAEKKFDKKRIGQVKGISWETKFELAFEGPRRKILYGPGVYLGNIRTMGPMREQPYIFTHQLTTYAEAKSRYGCMNKDGSAMWERWEYVTKTRVQGLSGDLLNTEAFNTSINRAWGLTDIQEGWVEEIHYQDRFNNEYQIFLNGVAMLPVGFPLSAISPGGEYNVEKQMYQMINPFFAYGRSFVMKVREQSDIIDELLRLLILKTRKSIHPPYANRSGRVISPKVLMPGRITMGINADDLQPIGMESQGATSSEFQMFKILSEKLDENTVSRQFTGMQGRSGTTAFEVATLQKQAEKVLGLTLFACTMLEIKIAYRRLDNVLENWFEPTGTQLDEARGQIAPKYRSTSRAGVNLGNEGTGIRQVQGTDVTPPPGAIREQELVQGAPEGMDRKKAGMPPLKKIYVNAPELRKARLLWYIDIESEEKDTSNTKKLMFREELNDIMALINLGAQPNVDELESTHALIWNRQKDKLFASSSQRQPAQAAAGSSAAGQGTVKPAGGPGVALPPNMGAAVAMSPGQ